MVLVGILALTLAMIIESWMVLGGWGSTPRRLTIYDESVSAALLSALTLTVAEAVTPARRSSLARAGARARLRRMIMRAEMVHARGTLASGAILRAGCTCPTKDYLAMVSL